MSNMPSSHQTLHFHITSLFIYMCIFHASFWIYGSYNYLTSGIISPPVCQFQLTSSLWITFCCSFLCPITFVFDAKHHTFYLVQYLLSAQSCKNSGEAETVLTTKTILYFFCTITGELVSTGIVPCYGVHRHTSSPSSRPSCSLRQDSFLADCCSRLQLSFTMKRSWVSLDAPSAQDSISSHVSQDNKCKFGSLREINILWCPLGTTASHMII